MEQYMEDDDVKDRERRQYMEETGYDDREIRAMNMDWDPFYSLLPYGNRR
jgi:hypothetical protein